ncbi:hypothetical protein [Flavobacterium croceum]|uniref:hypothetical protein n=1 Tax=Flavobacterium croceum TaxID=370975 RepID=UPI0024A97923|nr:hypothetical protein [Flavobacterium croceum]
MKIEDLSKVLDEIKIRFSSRFITYFIVYWLIFHWRISVALIWYDRSQIQAEGCRSIFEFIRKQLIVNNYHCEVFWYALGSTIAFPIIKTMILAFDAIIVVCRKNWISKINKDELFYKNIELEKKIDNINNVKLLDGQWIFSFSKFKYDNNVKTPQTIYIINGEWYSLNEEGIKIGPYFRIENFFLNEKGNQLSFTKNVIKLNGEITYFDKNKYNVLTLNNGNINFLRGTENGEEVDYEKIK